MFKGHFLVYNRSMEENQLPLEDYLKELYPDANDDQINYYIELISERSTEALPPTPQMLRIIEVKRQLKALEKEEEDLKKEIIKQKERLGVDFQLVKVSKVTSHYFNEEGFFEFVSGIVSRRVLKDLTIKTIDIKKFKELEAQGKISYDVLPDNLYRSQPSYRINIPRK